MHPSDWIALVAVALAALNPMLSTIRLDGRRDGKVDAVLEQLTAIAEDHEIRLRAGKLLPAQGRVESPDLHARRAQLLDAVQVP